MNRPTSLYLDLIRFLAAMMVFLAHASQGRWSGRLLWQIEPMGIDAVVIFFVLSGFVIGYAAAERERSARTYTINRMARIYSVAIPALILTFILDPIGRAADPSLYLNWPDYVPGQVTWQLLNSVLFTNQIWLNHVQPGSIGPYWSMGYEVPYYVAFGIAAFAPRRWGGVGAAAVMLVAGPNVAALFPMWLLGFGSYRFCAKYPLGKWTGVTVWALSIVALAFALIPDRKWQLLFNDIVLTPEQIRDLLHFYVIAFLFAANIVGFRGASPLFATLLEFAARPIRWAGERTFALYLFHMPLIQFIVAVTPWAPVSWPMRGLVYFGVPTVVFVLATFTERRKAAWRRGFDTLLGAKPRLKTVP